MSKASSRAGDDLEVPAFAFARGIRGRHAARFKREGSSPPGVPVRQDVWAPLVEFNWAGTDYALVPDVWIKKTVPVKELLSRSEAERFLSREERDSCEETRHWLHFVRTIDDELSPAAAVNSALLALWIARPTATHAPVRFAQTPSEFSAVRILDRFQWVPGASAEAINDGDLAVVAGILPPLLDVYLSGGRLRNAIVLTFRGCVSVDWQSAFICFTAAAEAMLTYSDKPGITERLANTYGRLVASSASDRKIAVNRFKKVYAVRSDIVHGRSHDRRYAKRNLVDLADCSDLLRGLWRLVLESGGIRKALERDDTARQSFFLREH
jgi:Apea-like HEPN